MTQKPMILQVYFNHYITILNLNYFLLFSLRIEGFNVWIGLATLKPNTVQRRAVSEINTQQTVGMTHLIVLNTVFLDLSRHIFKNKPNCTPLHVHNTKIYPMWGTLVLGRWQMSCSSYCIFNSIIDVAVFIFKH